MQRASRPYGPLVAENSRELPVFRKHLFSANAEAKRERGAQTQYMPLTRRPPHERGGFGFLKLRERGRSVANTEIYIPRTRLSLRERGEEPDAV